MMISNNYYTHSQWASRLVFIMAVTGSAVGLGNIWRFPYITGEYGGGAFVVLYIFFVLVMGLPVMLSEVMLGRLGKRNTVDTFSRFHREYGASPIWKVIGLMGIITGVLILSFYSVIAGWLVIYIFHSATGTFESQSVEGFSNLFNMLLADPKQMILYHGLFMLITAIVCMRNINAGIGKVVYYFMPLLLILIIGIIIYNFYNADMGQAVRFLFLFRWQDMQPDVILVALGQAFFSLSLGMGAVMIYGSYLSDSEPLLATTSTIVVIDTLVAILACLMIFPILFAFNLEPAAGPGLIFKTLPIAFSQMPGGALFGFIFFVLLFIVAWTSAFSLLEPAVAWLTEHTRWTRSMAAAIAALVIWLLGFATVFSFNIWQEVKLWEMTPFNLIDNLTSNITLPLGGLLIVLFAGWVLPATASKKQFGLSSDTYYQIWRWSARYFCPILIMAILIANQLGET